MPSVLEGSGVISRDLKSSKFISINIPVPTAHPDVKSAQHIDDI